MRNVIRPILLFGLLAAPLLGLSQSIVGKWVTIDDETGDKKSVVEITERNEKLYGTITKLFRKPGEDPDPVCDECPVDDERYNKKVIGMEIIRDMSPDGNEYSDGTILDPKVGRIYRCRLWLDGENLKVRGYWGPFFRTQVWQRSN
ncbi:MAG: DUF2147 domain-containing protein [Cyclobacteriaceae bacterium]